MDKGIGERPIRRLHVDFEKNEVNGLFLNIG